MQTISTLSLMAFVGILATQTGPTAKPEAKPLSHPTERIADRDTTSVGIGDMSCKSPLAGGQSFLEYPT